MTLYITINARAYLSQIITQFVNQHHQKHISNASDVMREKFQLVLFHVLVTSTSNQHYVNKHFHGRLKMYVEYLGTIFFLKTFLSIKN